MTEFQAGPATSLVEGDLIIVTLSAAKPDGSRVAIHKTFDWQGNRVPPGGGASLTFGAQGGGTQPQFPLDEYNVAFGESEEAAGRIIENFRKAVEAYSEGGGTTLAERIGAAVYAVLQSEDGVSEEDHDGLVLEKDQVMAKAPTRTSPDQPGVWLIQLTPTWGI